MPMSDQTQKADNHMQIETFYTRKNDQTHTVKN